MLMDLFFESARVCRKQRVHFNAFMLDVHDSKSVLPPSPLPSLKLLSLPYFSLPPSLQGSMSSSNLFPRPLEKINPTPTTPLVLLPEILQLKVTSSASMSSKFVYHSISQYITVYYSISQYITVYYNILQYITVYYSISFNVVYYSIQHVTVSV